MAAAVAALVAADRPMATGCDSWRNARVYYKDDCRTDSLLLLMMMIVTRDTELLNIYYCE